MPGRVVDRQHSGGSFPFLRELAARGRIVVTATEFDGAALRHDFPEHLISPALTRSGRRPGQERARVGVGALRAYEPGRGAHFERQGLLATERALLDDTGDGNGSEAPGSNRPEPRARIEDGALARATYLERDRPPATPTGAGRAAGRRRIARRAGRAPQAAQADDARRNVGARVRGADDRPGASVAANPVAGSSTTRECADFRAPSCVSACPDERHSRLSSALRPRHQLDQQRAHHKPRMCAQKAMPPTLLRSWLPAPI